MSKNNITGYLTGASPTTLQTDAGQSTLITPYQSFGIGPPTGRPVNDLGPVTARVTLTDEASHLSGTFNVPFFFWSTGAGNWVSPLITNFQPQTLTLGEHTYKVITGDDQKLRVFVTDSPVAAPEPASAVLACLGLAGVGVRRLRNRQS